MKCYVLDSLDEQFQSDQQRKEVSAEVAEKINMNTTVKIFCQRIS